MENPAQKLAVLQDQARQELEKIASADQLEAWRAAYLGRNGKLKAISEGFAKMPAAERRTLGAELNRAKSELVGWYEKRREIVASAPRDVLDFSRPGEQPAIGHLNPMSADLAEMKRIFLSLGFDIYDGNEIVTEWENFDSLNMPESHPARDMWDTLWVNSKFKIQNSKLIPKGASNRLLLRTHTSAHQVEFLSKNPPPCFAVIPGKTFRHEATDRRHEMQFYQLEGIAVARDISLAHFKGVIQEFFKRFFKKNINAYIRPGYFPFTEPSVEVDLDCVLCDMKGCSVCKYTKVLEVAGAGMIHPTVLENAGIDHTKYQGFAFGFGPNRLSMLKHNIPDIRMFASGYNREFLEQF